MHRQITYSVTPVIKTNYTGGSAYDHSTSDPDKEASLTRPLTHISHDALDYMHVNSDFKRDRHTSVQPDLDLNLKVEVGLFS